MSGEAREELTEKVTGIVIYCTDPRRKNANLWKHIKQILIPHDKIYAPVGLFGAPVALARPADLPIKYAAVMEDFHMAHERFTNGAGKVLIVGHDCGIYEERIRHRRFTLREKAADIVKAAKFIKKRVPHMLVSAYIFNATTRNFDLLIDLPN